MTKDKKTKGKKGKVVGKDKPTSPPKSAKGRRPAPVKTPKNKKGKAAKRGPKITAETYNKMQDAYFAKQSMKYAAKEAGVAEKTAKFYIEGPGKPEVGLVPIKQLWLDAQVEAQERKQLTLVRFQEAQVEELKEIVGTTLGELKLVRAEVVRRLNNFKASGGKEIETGATMSSALKSYERACKLMERMLGRPDMTLKAEGEDKYKNWTDDEIIEFMATGKIPDHAR